MQSIVIYLDISSQTTQKKYASKSQKAGLLYAPETCQDMMR